MSATEGFIISKLNGLVIDIPHGQTGRGIPVQTYTPWPLTNPESVHQVWKLEPSGQGDGYSYIKSLSNTLVLDIEGANTNPGTQIVTYTKNDPPSYNQLWILDSSGESDSGGEWYYIKSAMINFNLVLDIKGAATDRETPIISNTQKLPVTLADSQLWRIVSSAV